MNLIIILKNIKCFGLFLLNDFYKRIVIYKLLIYFLYILLTKLPSKLNY
jgi:hypothetical protein